jgi:hypothetical protein
MNMPPTDAPPPGWDSAQQDAAQPDAAPTDAAPADAAPSGWDSAQPDAGGPPCWMRVEDIFHIRGRGTVITGKLQGFTQLNRGDKVHCDGVSWLVSNIEMFAKSMSVAEPGSQIGVLLGGGPPGDMLRGCVVTFGPLDGGPQFDTQMGPSLGIVEPKKKRWRR